MLQLEIQSMQLLKNTQKSIKYPLSSHSMIINLHNKHKLKIKSLIINFIILEIRINYQNDF